jgi:hypothetical protein
MTTEKKHTPGPWVSARRRGNWDYLVAQQADGMNNEICQMFHDGTDLNETGEANALLVAAAPDLLAALIALDGHWTEDFPHGPDGDGPRILADETLTIWRATRAAIAKATSHV